MCINIYSSSTWNPPNPQPSKFPIPTTQLRNILHEKHSNPDNPDNPPHILPIPIRIRTRGKCSNRRARNTRNHRRPRSRQDRHRRCLSHTGTCRRSIRRQDARLVFTCTIVAVIVVSAVGVTGTFWYGGDSGSSLGGFDARFFLTDVVVAVVSLATVFVARTAKPIGGLDRGGGSGDGGAGCCWSRMGGRFDGCLLDAHVVFAVVTFSAFFVTGTSDILLLGRP